MKRTTLRSFVLFAEGVLFTVIVPGTVTVWLPRVILGNATQKIAATWGAVQYAALLVAGMGAVVYFWCLWDFVAGGRGIPLPIDHPKRLVVRGLYRHVRNPMYLGVLCVLLGEVIFFRSSALFLYTIAWFVIVNGVVLLYEEPALRTKFGPAYDRYAQSVRRWLPGRGYGGGPDHLTRFQRGFAALVLAQAAHSVEEYVGRLWESFPPARFLTGLISQDPRQGFVVINVFLVAFGIWCFLWPVRRQWPSAVGLAWVWVGIELINGIGHPLWSLRQFSYTPGVATAPVLLMLALYLATRLSASKQQPAA